MRRWGCPGNHGNGTDSASEPDGVEPVAFMMDGFVSIDEGDQKFTTGPFKGRTYRQVHEDRGADAKKWVEGVLTAKPEKLPQYQVPFRSWVEERLERPPSIPQCTACVMQKVQGTNATHVRYKCTVSGFRTSVLREQDRARMDPETCPHERLTRLGSTKKFVNYWCPDCKTTVDRVTRVQAEQADALAKKLFEELK